MKKSNGRILNLDVARILAVLAVVMIHTSADFVIVYDSATAEFFWGNICDSISRIGVPLFLMISGALMLDENREISMENLVKKNIKGIVLLLIFWSFIYDIRYQIIPPLMHGEALDMKSVITNFLYGHYHMWYLYMIIGLYFITPYLRCIVRHENRNMVLCFIGIGLLVQFTKPMINGLTSIWSSFNILSKFIDKFNLKFFSGYTLYYLAGWYIVHVGFHKKIEKYIIYMTSAVSALITILYVRFTRDYDNGYSNMNIFIFLYAVGVFYALVNLRLGKESNPRRENMIRTMSKLTFGVYIVHLLILDECKKILPFTKYPLVYMAAIWSLTCCLSFAICHLASKNAITKKLIRA